MVAIAKLDELRTIAFGDISAAYAAVGSASEHLIRIFCITNNTEGDMLFTTNNTRDELFVPAGCFKLIDVQSNMNAQFDDKYVLPIGTQFYVKQSTAPVSGDVYIEFFY